MSNRIQKTIYVLPKTGDCYWITIPIPIDRDEEEFVNEWLELNTINIDDWEWEG